MSEQLEFDEGAHPHPDRRPGADVDPPVHVVRSSRRRKTVSAVYRDGRIEVRVPAGLADEEVRRSVDELVPKVTRKVRSERVDLSAMATRLARQYELPAPTSIRWVGNQRRQWGSCSTNTGTIRISDRLGAVPPFVLEAVVLHEMTHLVVADHGPRFRALMARYPRLDEATGYLSALSDHGLV